MVRVVMAEDSVLPREWAARLLKDGAFDGVASAGDADALLRRPRGCKAPTGRFHRSSREKDP